MNCPTRSCQGELRGVDDEWVKCSTCRKPYQRSIVDAPYPTRGVDDAVDEDADQLEPAPRTGRAAVGRRCTAKQGRGFCKKVADEGSELCRFHGSRKQPIGALKGERGAKPGRTVSLTEEGRERADELRVSGNGGKLQPRWKEAETSCAALHRRIKEIDEQIETLEQDKEALKRAIKIMAVV